MPVPRKGVSRRPERPDLPIDDLRRKLLAMLPDLREVATMPLPSFDRSDVEQQDVKEDETLVETELRAMNADELARVYAALERIRQGTYGHCVDCGVLIPRARLNEIPYAERCKLCQSDVEAGESDEPVRKRPKYRPPLLFEA
ncbi:MAG: TraR/DksA family transcriptional regulator [Candidatus Peribacteraceae bacterium]|nr:TraR/DksA family transcriptional regulator [Candidatus Peribacteraceae bacterium]